MNQLDFFRDEQGTHFYELGVWYPNPGPQGGLSHPKGLNPRDRVQVRLGQSMAASGSVHVSIWGWESKKNPDGTTPYGYIREFCVTERGLREPT